MTTQCKFSFGPAKVLQKLTTQPNVHKLASAQNCPQITAQLQTQLLEYIIRRLAWMNNC